MAVTGHGGTFTFVSNRGVFRGGVTRVSVDAPTAEIVDMTDIANSVNAVVLAPTGCWRGGSISVDYVVGTATVNAQLLIRGFGQLSFASPKYNIQRQVVLESASESVSVGEVVRGSLKFVLTDYYGP
jgi:hypothetical protein